MAVVGDTVRYLNSTGGGKVTKIEGRLAYVEEDGFETPVLMSEIVVVMPAGHEKASGGARLMFDQEAFDKGKTRERETPAAAPKAEPEPEEFPVEETEYGDAMTLMLTFEPKNIKDLERTDITMSLVNDSNYFLFYLVLRRDDASHSWVTVARGEAAPNEYVDLCKHTLQTIVELERLVFQAIAYKKDKPFFVKTPINVSRKLDLMKFHKLHCYRPGMYSETPVIEVPLLAERIAKN